MAQQWHPDKHDEGPAKEKATKMFMDIAAAKEVLSDPGMCKVRGLSGHLFIEIMERLLKNTLGLIGQCCWKQAFIYTPRQEMVYSNFTLSLISLLTDKRQMFDQGEDPLDPEEQQKRQQWGQPFGGGFNPFGSGGGGGGGFNFKFNFP